MRFARAFLFAVPLFAQTTQPSLLSKVEPEYSEEARRAQVNSTATVKLIVGSDGVPKDLAILRSAGFGLDDKAIAAVSAWRFKPATKNGTPVDQIATVVVSFRLLNPTKHEDQFARLNFNLPPGASRPELTDGRIPENPPDVDAHTLSIAFTISQDGRPRDVHTLNDSPVWAESVVRQLSGWRFRPARAGKAPVEVEGVLELSRGDAPARPAPATSSRTIDSSLAAPRLILPNDGAVFDIYPRTTKLQWAATPGAASYLVETEYSDDSGWHAGTRSPVRDTQFTFDFIGAQLGRWRIVPVNSQNVHGAPSEWRTFRYTR